MNSSATTPRNISPMPPAVPLPRPQPAYVEPHNIPLFSDTRRISLAERRNTPLLADRTHLRILSPPTSSTSDCRPTLLHFEDILREPHLILPPQVQLVEIDPLHPVRSFIPHQHQFLFTHHLNLPHLKRLFWHSAGGYVNPSSDADNLHSSIRSITQYHDSTSSLLDTVNLFDPKLPKSITQAQAQKK
ncbi:hypothetical protein SARC_03095 [Sphaeroforma arctica JP610]|uniref:Uncharacterized protein n=1 Tax=Sphaeroforma arctica JP610 TaxID=667725 RepID=A0A0L0G6P8_9EUKA|nr:hypothetical protein SARC_03095 [Sphaeroforma arctica JP610]KNC84690.1 hypothetical protein SARC_03095 [Sphaeroforma arctica JP610]|eukprot:XP_014158592.1 hypothetical protein SARC_03095 [Sphaeroforma arctica JP610]